MTPEETRQKHINDGVCSMTVYAKMCTTCRTAFRKGCVCNPSTGVECMKHFDLDQFILAEALRNK